MVYIEVFYLDMMPILFILHSIDLTESYLYTYMHELQDQLESNKYLHVVLYTVLYISFQGW